MTIQPILRTKAIGQELGGPTSYKWFGEIVFAESRGKARAIFCEHYDLEFTFPLTIRRIATNTRHKPGLARYGELRWWHYVQSDNDLDLPDILNTPEALKHYRPTTGEKTHSHK